MRTCSCQHCLISSTRNISSQVTVTNMQMPTKNSTYQLEATTKLDSACRVGQRSRESRHNMTRHEMSSDIDVERKAEQNMSAQRGVAKRSRKGKKMFGTILCDSTETRRAAQWRWHLPPFIQPGEVQRNNRRSSFVCCMQQKSIPYYMERDASSSFVASPDAKKMPTSFAKRSNRNSARATSHRRVEARTTG